MLRFYELSLSPNSTKVRMALRYKGVAFEAIEVPPADRASVLELSGQELTPVIADRGIVLNDSEAILNYLDANYRDAPRLIPADRAGRKECDRFKEDLDQRLVPAWFDVFMFAIRIKESMDPASPGRFREALEALEGELGADGTWGGADKPICDLRVAEWATYAFPGAGLVQRVPLFGKLQELFGAEAGSLPRLEAALAPWQARLA